MNQVQSICVISEDANLLVKLIGWLDRQTPDESKFTTIYVCEGDVRNSESKVFRPNTDDTNNNINLTLSAFLKEYRKLKRYIKEKAPNKNLIGTLDSEIENLENVLSYVESFPEEQTNEA